MILIIPMRILVPPSAFYFPNVNTEATLDIDMLAFYIEYPSKNGQAGDVDIGESASVDAGCR